MKVEVKLSIMGYIYPEQAMRSFLKLPCRPKTRADTEPQTQHLYGYLRSCMYFH